MRSAGRMAQRIGWLMLAALTTGCTASVRPGGKPINDTAPGPQTARVELPAPEEATAADATRSPEQADLSTSPVDTAVEQDNAPRPASRATQICGCKGEDVSCALSCEMLIASPQAMSDSTAFDRGAASTQMNIAVGIARSHCARNGGPVGSARVIVHFATSGRVASATIGSPFTDTDTGSCIVRVFRLAVIPPFKGSPMSVSKSIKIDSGD